jgi:thioredoxin 1
MIRKLILSLVTLSLLISGCNTGNKPAESPKLIAGEIVTPLTNDTFRKYIFDYESEKVWNYKGDKPAIIDFYADWCPPCRELSPLVEEVAKEYAGKIVVYKVNTDHERAVTQALGISGLPTLVFIPVKGKPQLVVGFVSKENLIKGVNEVLLK